MWTHKPRRKTNFFSKLLREAIYLEILLKFVRKLIYRIINYLWLLPPSCRARLVQPTIPTQAQYCYATFDNYHLMAQLSKASWNLCPNFYTHWYDQNDVVWYKTQKHLDEFYFNTPDPVDSMTMVPSTRTRLCDGSSQNPLFMRSPIIVWINNIRHPQNKTKQNLHWYEIIK